MNIIIVGAGLVGTSLAEHLLRHGHAVAIIDSDQQRSEDVSEKLDAMVLHGSGSNPVDLERAGLETADMLIAATPVDDTNLLSCMIAQQYDVKHRIARIRNTDFMGGTRLKPEQFGITQVIYPEANTLDAVLNFIETPFAIDAQDFHGRSVLLRTFQVKEGMPIVNRTLSFLREEAADKMLLVVAIIRGDEVLIPRGDTVILPGDEPVLIFPRGSREYVLALFGQSDTGKMKAVVFGNTLTAVNIARTLGQQLDSVVFIDPDSEHGNLAAAKLHGIDVLLGDGDDADVLREANVRFADFFIAASESTTMNVLSCLLARSEGAREVIAIVNDDQHIDLFLSIGLNHIVNPRQLTAHGILNAVIPGFISPAMHIQKTDIDVMRFAVRPGAQIEGKSLKDGWKKAIGVAVVGAIIRDGAMIIPTGDSIMTENDLVIVFCRAAGINRVKKLFH